MKRKPKKPVTPPVTPQVVDNGEPKVPLTPGGALRQPTVGKGRFDLLPPEPEYRYALHMEAGANKYAARNWEKGLPLSNLADCMFRHLNKFRRGDRGEDHLAAALWNLGCYMQTERWIAEGRLSVELYDVPWPPTTSDMRANISLRMLPSQGPVPPKTPKA